ncbi:MAG: tRNA lysidine(34) synthetase TilS [Candidatus Aminicenantes bacterium]
MILTGFKKAIREYHLLEKKDRILVAYSGGLDSSCLLALLLEVGEEWDFEIFLGHFNHKLRPGAEEDVKFVQDVASRHSLPLILGSEDVRSYAHKKGLGVEEAGRRLRYEFLKKTARERGLTKIATGHTMTDQAETLLMRLMRGSGPRGLASIYPMVEGLIVRPLLQLERDDIQDWMRKKRIPYRIDESNFDPRFFRNKIRMELIPYIQKNFEPRIIPQLAKAASILREEEVLLERLAQEKAQRAIVEKDRRLSLDINILHPVSPALGRRVVREFIHRLKGNLKGVSFKDVESVLRLERGKEHHLEKNLILCREEDLVFIKKPRTQISYEYLWEGKDPVEIKEINSIFEGNEKTRKPGLHLDFNDEAQAYLDREKLRFPLLIRNRRPGDKYQPLGAPGQKKLKEIMRAKGIPLSEREDRPVFFSGEEIVWVLGLPVSEKFKISTQTKTVFAIKKS